MVRLLALAALVAGIGCAHGGADSGYAPGLARAKLQWVHVDALPEPQREQVIRAVVSNLSGMQHCAGLRSDQELIAYFVRIFIARDGRHDGGLVIPPALQAASAAVDLCLHREIKRWRFAPLDGPWEGVWLTVPLELRGRAYDMSRELERPR